VLLANTLADTRDGGSGRGPGYNDLYASIAMIPADDPTAQPEVRQFRFQQTRFPVGGIKSPVDGVVPIAPSDFVNQCLPPTAQTTGP
jgi:hypothetical protein